MKKKTGFGRFVAGLTAFLLVLTPMPFAEMGISGGIGMTASAEEVGNADVQGETPAKGEDSGETPTDGEENGADNGETPTGGEENNSDNGGTPDSGDNNGSEDGGQPDDDENTDPEEDDDSSDDDEEATEIEEIWISGDSCDLPDSDDLFDDYVNRVFYGDTGLATFDNPNYGEKSLTRAIDKQIYQSLKTQITKIANGTRSNTQITVNLSQNWTNYNDVWTKIVHALLADLPYDFYWFDKTEGYSLGGTTKAPTFSFSVAGAYKNGSSQYVTDTEKTGATSKSVANAQAIVKTYSSESDYSKLYGYLTEICDLVEYNHDAVNNNYAYGDPWQIIYAFDGDPTTNIVCEGYAKAFKYLCDLSTFENSSINCALVTGNAGGNHMWNIVSIDDISYMVDVTNCDGNAFGNPDYLFLKGMKNPTSSGFTAYANGMSLKYTYNTDTKEMYSSKFLTVSAEDYVAFDSSYTINLTDDVLYFMVNDKFVDGTSVTVDGYDKVYVCADIKDYIDHKLTCSEVRKDTGDMYFGDDGTYYYERIIIDPDDISNDQKVVNIGLAESKWDKQSLASVTKLVLDDDVTVYPFIDEKIKTDRPLTNGDYVRNYSFDAVISVNNSNMTGKFISINGVKAEGQVLGGKYQIKYSGVHSNDNGEFVVRISDNGYEYHSNSYYVSASVENTYLNDGSIVENGAKIRFTINTKYYIDHKLVINGKTVNPTLNNIYNTFFEYEYTVDGADVNVELTDEKWSETELAKFVKFGVSNDIVVYAYNKNNDTGYIPAIGDGDYYPRGAYIQVNLDTKTVDSGKKLLVNDEEVPLTLVSDEYSSYYTYISKVDPKGDTLTIEFSSAVTLLIEDEENSISVRNNFDTIDDAFKYFSKVSYNNTDVTLIINQNMTITKLAIPTKVRSFTITNKNYSKVNFNMSALNIPVDTTLRIEGDGENLKPITISVAAGKTLDYEVFPHYGSVTVKGTKTSVLNINGFLTLNGISTFGEVNVADGVAVSVEGNVTAVTHFNGALWLKDPKYSAAITNFGKGTVRLYDVDGKNAKVTISDIDEDGELKVELVDPNTTNETKINSGRTILYAGSTKNFTDKVTVVNTNTAGQTLNAYLYGKEIRAEYGGAVSLSSNGGKEKLYPNLDLAIADMKEAASYTITLYDNITVSKLVLPKNASKIIFNGADNNTVFSLNLTALNIPVNTTFNVNVAGVNAKPLAISVAAKAALEINGSFDNLGAVRGTATSTLTVGEDITAASLATFKEVKTNRAVITVTGNVSGVAAFNGELKLPNVKSTAAITTADVMYLDLVEDGNGAVAKVTVTNVSDSNAATDNPGILIRIIDSESGSLSKLTCGKTVLWTAGKNSFTENIRIENISASNHELSPFLYGREIKAEYAKAIRVDDGNANTYYPNIDSAFKAINDKSVNYIVYLNEDVSASKLVFPKNAGFIGFTGSGSFELNMTTLAIPVDTEFGVALKGTNAKPLALTVAANKTLIISNEIENIGAVKGANTSSLYVNRNATVASLASFGDVVAIGANDDAVLSVTGNVTGVKNLSGTLALPNIKSTAAVTNTESAVLQLTDINGMSAKVTVTDVIGNAPLKVVFVDESGKQIGLGAGKTVLWMGGKYDISDKVELVNNAKFGNAIELNVYGKEVRADCGNAVTVTCGGVSENFVSLDSAFAAINKQNTAADYVISINENVSASKLTFPQKANMITFIGNGSINLNMTALNIPVNTAFRVCLNGTNAKPLAITVAAGTALVFDEGAVASNIGAVKGGKNSVFENNEPNTVASIASFNLVYASQLINVTGNVSGVAFLYGFIGLPNAKSTMTVSYIFGETTVGLTDNNGSFAKVTVSGMYDEEAELIMSVVDEEADPIMLPSGKTILWSNGKYDFTEQVAFVNESASSALTAKLVGKEIKAVNENAVTLATNSGTVGSFATIEEAFAKINNANTAYTITLNDDVYAAKFTLPAKAASLTIKGNDHNIQLNNISSIASKYDLTVEDVTIKNTKSFTLTAQKNLTLENVKSDCISAVKGTAKFKFSGSGNVLTFMGKNGAEPTKITGFGNTAK